MNNRHPPLHRFALLLALGALLLATLTTGKALAQPPRPTRLPPINLTPAPPLLRVTPAPTLAPSADSCIHLTTDGAPGAAFVGGRIGQRCFVFPANAGATASIQLTTAAGARLPGMELRGPDGQVIARSAAGAITDQALSQGGSYTLIVQGAGIVRPLRVEVAVTVPEAAGSFSGNAGATALCGGTLTPGEMTTGMTPFPGENCHFTFLGQEGQGVALRMERLSSDLAPHLTLVAPDGEVLDTGHPLNATTSYVSALKLPATGVYTAVAGSVDDRSAGAFRLTLDPLQAAQCDDTLAFNQLTELALPASEKPCDLWLELPEPSFMSASVTGFDGAQGLDWQLSDPNGEIVASNQEASLLARTAGQYLLRIRSASGRPGRALIQILPPTFVPHIVTISCGANLTYGQSPGTVPQTLREVGDRCLFNFTGKQGDLVWVAVSRAYAGENFEPMTELLPPGYTATSAPEATAPRGQVPGMTILRDHPLARSGRYTVRVSDYDNDDTGSFYIMVWKRTPVN